MKSKLAQTATKEWHEQIMGAVARGWCHTANSSKTMDSDLAMAITEEIETLIKTDENPRLGCATTRQLIGELIARMDIDMDYRTIDSD